MNENITYSVGGYLPEHPNGNVIERCVDNGDGTGTLTTYDSDGEVVSVEELSGLPVAEPEPIDPMSALRVAVQARLTDPAVNSIAKVKSAVIAAFDDAIE